MEQSRVLLALALVLYVLSLVELTPGFVPATAEKRSPSALRGGGLAAERPGVAPAAGSAPAFPVWGLRGTSALLALGAVAVAMRDSRGRPASGRAARIVRQADASELTPKGPVVVYTEALQQAAAQKEESVPVTKDVMKLKKALEEDDEEFLPMLLERNTPGFTQIDEAELYVRLLQPLESTVLPKFLIYLAKKKRLMSLKKILNQYVQTLYISQSIEPVRVTSATVLTEDQKTAIKDKMKEKLGVDDIKLICSYDTSLLGGFKVEYGFTDPDRLLVPSYITDISLKSYIESQAIKEGVVPA